MFEDCQSPLIVAIVVKAAGMLPLSGYSFADIGKNTSCYCIKGAKGHPRNTIGSPAIFTAQDERMRERWQEAQKNPVRTNTI